MRDHKGILRTDYATTFMCALDFVRALNERPAWIKWLCRPLFGKWAYSEFKCLIRALDNEKYQPFYSYGLEEASYHRKEPWRWWKS